MKRKIGFIMIGVIVISVSLSLVLNSDKISPNKQTNSHSNKISKSPILQIDEKNRQPVEKEFPMNMSEYDVQVAIHAMSHQKVKAEDKWISIVMTSDRVNRLLEIVKAKDERFEKNGPLYLEILQRWASGDFSKVDQDHNAIWQLQGGTVGRATGILTEQQEEDFIAEQLTKSEEDK
ncbi:DUF6241 domain-containing protein [Sporosarcina sp. D27]|uniref:DUF6241 domain-containing protein n=1 Tax=Sporosarcina sp. D27 TaxID=1382305 RepID=UPI00046E9C67|nr:DUF6241 domain-containing protein [Sporosarcina sp. D27]